MSRGPDDIFEAIFFWLFPDKWFWGIILSGAAIFLFLSWMGWL